KKTVFSGAYSGRTCLHQKPSHNGKYEWLPGPGANNKFFGFAEEPVLQTVGGQTISCAAGLFKGEYTGAKTEKMTASLEICEDAAKRPCQTTPAKEGVISEGGTLEGDLGYIDSTKKTVGWDLEHEGGSGAIFTYYCGKLPETIHMVEGSVIGQVKPGFFGNDLNKMSKKATISYKASKGKQLPEAFEGQPNDTLTTTTLGLETRPNEQTGLTTLLETVSGEGEDIPNEAIQEPLEVKTKEH
ncbi:MAG TPA: hypothetical protein VK774_09200, partial [Solirubrobacteraceae bacterium]|nr:hypothetical protein [Solirubrobacteraceae bacterium]